MRIATIGVLESPSGVFQAVTSHGENDSRTLIQHAGLGSLQQPRDTNGRGGFRKDADGLGKEAMRCQNPSIINLTEIAVAIGLRSQRKIPRSRITNTNSGRDGVGVFHPFTPNKRCCTRGLEAKHSRNSIGSTAAGFFGIPPVICGVVSGISNRKEVVVRCLSQDFNYFKSRRLLAFDAVIIDGVHQMNGVVISQIPSQIEAIIKVALHLQNVSVVGDGLGKFAHGNFSIRNQHC